ncbi:hypothetical protein KUH32_03435 [Thalassococcus sp. CAU 1522]|uniref:Uncharacterized protein n=1 Tax=Thalassococcus arenae TaxID=2851652 RepID=A0ABS6N5K4_9RHOB|nr:hypothetical protein [Thalassococcus arenae]MBV2358815.1 hypothetical protein [Thalassococcus arenae]
MEMLIGSGALLASAMIYVWANTLHHRDTAPLWARGQFFASAVCLSLVVLAPLGAGLAADGLAAASGEARYASLGAMAVAGLVLWRQRLI